MSCTERKTTFLEVSRTDRQSPQGELLLGVSALVTGGQSLGVRLYINLEAEAIDRERVNSCRPYSEYTYRGRGSEQETELETHPCYYTELIRQDEEAVGGSIFDGQINLGPINIGESVSFRLRATGGSQVAWWPKVGSERVIVEGVYSALSISHIAPQTGPSSGGTTLLIRGEGFTDQSDLQLWLGSEPLTDIVVESPQLISAITARGPPGELVDLKIMATGRVFTLNEAFTFTPPPMIERIIPNEVSQNEETQVMIVGHHFLTQDPGTLVYEELTSAEGELIPITNVQRYDQSHIEITVPSREERLSKLILINPDQQRAEIELVRQPPPFLLSVSPLNGPDDQPTWILLEGQNLRAPATVWFDGRQALEVEVNPSGNRSRVKTPLHPGGLSDVVWFNPDGQSSRLDRAYQFRGAPRVNEASPTVISRCGGGITTLIGLNFTMNMSVYFNGLEGEVLEVNEEGTTATIRAPSAVNDMGDVDLVVVGPDGRRDREIGLLTYGIQPIVRRVDPTEAPSWGGTRALLFGSDLTVGSLFSIDGNLVERSTFISDGCNALVEIIIPPGEGEGVSLEVESLNGQFSVLPEAINYIPPQFFPSEGLTGGYTNLRLKGLDLRVGLAVFFNGRLPRELTQVNDEEWLILTPSLEVGPVEVEIRNLDGRGLNALDLYQARRYTDQGPDSLTALGECNHMTQGDFNNDGLQDIVLVMGSSSPLGQIAQQDLIYFGTGTGLGPRNTLPLSGNGMNVYSADIDGDQDLDLLTINLFTERNFLYLNDGLGNFREDPSFPSEQLGPSYDGGIFDANGDGSLDLFFMKTGDTLDNQTFGPERLLLRDGAAWVERSAQIDFDLDDVHDHDMIHGDLNEDGLDDVIIVVDNLPQSFPGNSNRILLNRGEGRFERVSSPINNYPGDWLDVALADINNDGHLDILMPQDYIEGISVGGTPSLAIFMGDGLGGFVDESFRAASLPPSPAFGVTPFDLDRDGDLDLLVAIYGISFGDGSVESFQSALLLNNGEGVFFGGNSSFNQVPFIPSAHFEVIDLDQDGRSDIVECAAESQSRVWLNE